MVSLTDISARLASVQTEITHIQIDIDKIDTYLDILATHTVSPQLLPPSTLQEIMENIKRGMAQYPQLALPNDHNQDIWI